MLKADAADVPARENAAERLAVLAYDDMRRVDALILERLDSHVALIPELARYLIEAGGKRVRPMITVAAANMLGHTDMAPIRLAAAVEFIHTATLLHDDVVDESGMRRGKVAANLVWGNASSVLVGDFLFARSFSLMVEAGSMKALGVLSAAASTIAEGEVRQLSAVKDIGVSVDTYMQIIDAKTAALFAAAAQVSGIVAARPSDEEAALETYGRELGLAFQLVDDALDYGGAAAKLGKSTGDDFREGKVTLPVALSLKQAGPDEAAFWRRVIAETDQKDGDFERALDYMNGHGALAATVEQARDHAARARAALSGFPDNAWRRALGDLADFVVERAY
ncbi:polyprenyl synthetase family protein [Maricaulis sp.]|uniref:polyprenyl synthetase family protein n=1 Tax=Maricaulis sp. TaxID=1486257 RepID=UPI001B16D4E6|nr:polyprenyl synthetase family protein [Maricaulis sp.]MBO6764770.1 polyprenyl synthetase family protein [Maricaulis sp.]